MYPIKFGTKSATCTIFVAVLRALRLFLELLRRRRRVSCNELLVQQLVWAIALRFAENSGLLQRWAVQRCGGESSLNLTRLRRAIAMQWGVRSGTFVGRVCTQEPGSVLGGRPETSRGLAERGAPSESSAIPSNSAPLELPSRNCLSRRFAGSRGSPASGTGEPPRPPIHTHAAPHHHRAHAAHTTMSHIYADGAEVLKALDE